MSHNPRSGFGFFQIEKDSRKINGWVKFYFVADEREFTGYAKVYNEGDGANDPNEYNGYGVSIGSRVSKLSILERLNEVYNWDRGFDHSELPEWVIEAVDEKLNELPILACTYTP